MRELRKSPLSHHGERIVIVLFLGGFLLGIFSGSWMRDSWLPAIPWLEPDFFWKIEKMQIDKRALFFLAAEKRLGAFFLLYLLAQTILCRAVNGIFFIERGLFAGIVLEILIVKYGITGGILYLGMVLPQSLFYLPGYYLLAVCCLRKRLAGARGVRGDKGEARGIIVGLGMVIIGIFMESMINPEWIKKISELVLR